MVTMTEAARLLKELGNPDRDIDAVVIGEPEVHCCRERVAARDHEEATLVSRFFHQHRTEVSGTSQIYNCLNPWGTS